MPTTPEEPSTDQKVSYRPIEAAIRWSGLLQHEHQILKSIGTRQRLDPSDFPEWPDLHFNVARIMDALANGDLAYGKDGITCDDPTLLESRDLTVRHVDLKAWMTHFYPDEKPNFLFNATERLLCPTVSQDTIQTLLADREALKIRLVDETKASERLQAQVDTLRQAREAAARQAQEIREPSPRSESTYLNIVAGLLTLLLGHSPAGHPYSSFNTQDAVISALIAHHGDRLGISQSTLENKFARAKQHSGTG